MGEELKTYKAGTIIKINDGADAALYMLARVGCSWGNTVAERRTAYTLICLKDGNRWCPIKWLRGIMTGLTIEQLEDVLELADVNCTILPPGVEITIKSR